MKSGDQIYHHPHLTNPRVLARRSFLLVLRLTAPRGSVVMKAALSGAPSRTRLSVFREAIITAFVKHDNLVALVGGMTMLNYVPQGQMALLLEDAGRTLRELLTDFPDGVPPPDVARQLSVQLLTGLRHLHALGIVHCDVKPTNIGVDACLRLRIFDFGQAQLIDAPNQPPAFGTRFFRAPETLEGAETMTTAADIWSAGCVIRELVGPAPEKREDEATFVRFLADREATEGCDKEVATLLRRMWQWQPEHRPSADEAMQSSFLNGIGGKEKGEVKPLLLEVKEMLSEPTAMEGRHDLRERIVTFMSAVEKEWGDCSAPAS